FFSACRFSVSSTSGCRKALKSESNVSDSMLGNAIASRVEASADGGSDADTGAVGNVAAGAAPGGVADERAVPGGVAAARAASCLRCDQRLSESFAGGSFSVDTGCSMTAVSKGIVASHLAPRLGLVMLRDEGLDPFPQLLRQRHRIDLLA